MTNLIHFSCNKLHHVRLAKLVVFLHIVVFGAVPLLIVGILKLFGPADGISLGRILAGIGLAIFFQVHIAQTFIALYAYKTREKQQLLPSLALVVLAMTPLLLVRMLYSTLAFFVTSSKTFSPSQGSLAAQVLMSIVPENSIALLAVGWGIFVNGRRSHGTAYELTSCTTS
jgi:hypothetical protein